MKVNKILEHFNISEKTTSDIDINYISNLNENARNSVMFINKLNYDPWNYLNKVNECLILISQKVAEKYNFSWTVHERLDAKNIILKVSDPKYFLLKIITELGIKDVYGLPSNYESSFSISMRSTTVGLVSRFHNAIVGEGCTFYHNCDIGFDDFSPIFDYSTGGLVMFPQLGNVIIGNNVSIHIGTIIGRGTFGSTIIGDHTKIDSYCQIGHNCQIGKNCNIAAGTIIAGSTSIGDNVAIGIGCKINNGLKIGSNVLIASGSVVTKDIPNNWRVAGVPAKKIGENPADWQVGYAFG